MKNNIFYISSLVALLFFISGIFSLAFSQPASEPIGQVVWVKGTVKAYSVDDKNARVLKRREAIYVNDTIVTDKTSTGQIVFTDGSLLSLRTDTTFKVSEYKHQPGVKGSDDKFVADIAKGGFRTITGAISKNNREGYQVKTPVATIGVRGTDYSIFYDELEGLDAKIYVGIIDLKNSIGNVKLEANSENLYAHVKGPNSAPSVTTSPPSSLANDVSIEPATVDGTLSAQPASTTGTETSTSSDTGTATSSEQATEDSSASSTSSTSEENTSEKSTTDSEEEATTSSEESDSSATSISSTDSGESTSSTDSSSQSVESSSTTGSTNPSTSTSNSNSFCIQ